MQISDEMKALEALARAYDHEEAACMGEPSPWVSADAEGDDEWKAERIVAARAGLDAYRAALSLPVQPVAWRDVIAERKRQVEKENWTPEHDDIHYTGDMARAASCYAYEATRTEEQRQQDVGNAPPLWPWDECWWKPTDPRRDLVKAGALILAEIERLDRASALTPSVQP